MESNPNVAVYCRLRKTDSKLLTINTNQTHMTVDTSQINAETSPSSKSKQKTFVLNKIFTEDDNQQVVYDTSCAPLIDNFLKGYNCAIMAYGGTGSGKTYTMMGIPKDQGLIPRAMNQIWDYIRKEPRIPNITVTVSIIEIYMERVADLLAVKKEPLKIVTLGDTMSVVGVKEETFTDVKTISRKLDAAFKNRAKASTNMNTDSSRSHAIVMVRCRQSTSKSSTPSSSSSAMTESTLFLVDLAGAEKQSDTGTTGIEQQQGAYINQSLSNLTNVMEALYKKSAYIPYRNSKLTLLMSKALGGNSKTSIIITCNPQAKQMDTVLRSLQFGDRARSMSNHAEISVSTISRSNSMDWKAKYMMSSAQLEENTKLIAELQNRLLEVSQQQQAQQGQETSDTKDEVEEVVDEVNGNNNISEISPNVSVSLSSTDISLKTDEEKKNLDSNLELVTSDSFSRRSSGSSSRRPSVLATVLEDSDRLHLQDILEKEIVITTATTTTTTTADATTSTNNSIQDYDNNSSDDSDSDSSMPALVLTAETIRRLTRPSVIAVPRVSDLAKLNYNLSSSTKIPMNSTITVPTELPTVANNESSTNDTQITPPIAKNALPEMSRLQIVPPINESSLIAAPVPIYTTGGVVHEDIIRMHRDLEKFDDDRTTLERKVFELEERLGISRETDEDVDNANANNNLSKVAHYPVTTWGIVCFYLSLVVIVIGIAMIIRSHTRKANKRSMVEIGGAWATLIGGIAFIVACIFD